MPRLARLRMKTRLRMLALEDASSCKAEDEDKVEDVSIGRCLVLQGCSSFLNCSISELHAIVLPQLFYVCKL